MDGRLAERLGDVYVALTTYDLICIKWFLIELFVRLSDSCEEQVGLK